MNNSQSSPTDSCTQNGCEGRRLPNTIFCLVHAETKDREEAYSDLRRGGELDLTRVQLDRSTLQRDPSEALSWARGQKPWTELSAWCARRHGGVMGSPRADEDAHHVLVR
jgi:hypothetical protein